MIRRLLMFIFLSVLPTAGSAHGQTDMAFPEPTHPDVAYGTNGRASHTLDVYLPSEGDAPYPTVLLIHGGGFEFGDKVILAPIAAYFAEHGYAAISMNYRLAPGAVYPAQVEDSFCALAWIHANAETYGFDITRIVASGESAGGYLAAMLGVVDDPMPFLADCPHALPETDWLRAVMPYYPMSGLGIEDYAPLAYRLFNQFLGVEPADAGYAARFAEASPVTYIDGSEPPFYIINGEADPLLPPGDSSRLYDALDAAGVDVELVLIPAREHAFIARLGTPAGIRSAELALAFMDGLGREANAEATADA